MLLLARALMLVLALICSTASAATGGAPEYQLKAVFLFNFTQFVEWPDSAFADKQSPVKICVLGTDPFGAYLDEAVQGETVNGRTLAVERIQQEQNVGCHVLFVSHSEEPRLAEIFKQLDGRNVLTVSDIDGFAEKGGVIGFVTFGSKIRLRINLASAKRADLTISSKLLRPAEIVASNTPISHTE